MVSQTLFVKEAQESCVGAFQGNYFFGRKPPQLIGLGFAKVHDPDS
ncbi:uncharacterized protein G2W53_042388 [Senna tora]|uniref:Uncharacterized protein n=1 Tax=Senna tora TaxID=362788 RepID=A0A834SGW5_9FABA|nr:uncharacterized protein G2W53_042388 [Senna tora]